MRNPAGSSVRRTRGVITISYYVPFRDIIRLRLGTTRCEVRRY